MPEGWLFPLPFISVKPKSKPGSGFCVVLCWALLGCISAFEGTTRPAVAGVLGASGEDTMASRDSYTLWVGVSSRSARLDNLDVAA